MTMLNVLLYLLLLLAGSAVALILADLHRAEESALEALAELDRGLAVPPAPVHAGRGQLPAPAFITLAGLPAMPTAAGTSAATAGPSFDFALACAPRAAAPATGRGPAVSGQPSMNDSRDWNCCA